MFNRCASSNFRRFNKYDGKPLANDIALRHRHLSHDAIEVRSDDVLHFHRFDNRQLLPRPHLFANLYVYSNNSALDR